MSALRHAHTYKAAAVHTATPGSLLLMLYDGAIKFMHIADKAFDCEDPLEYNQTIHNNLVKSQNIVRELRSALISKGEGEGQDLVNNLIALYDYFDRRLQEANVKKKREIVHEVIERMTDLRSAWAESYAKENEHKESSLQPKTPENGGSRLSMMG
ncbi:MAG: flagellar export chaperone FliS [Verrucomicrobiales bacterium]|nr:flagellar export chaperone FliS [Verrucomicrobiales bacterium]|tara:strand:- start:567 stop:1034 length:468 start_codon:yes stop_codon:yes gene_type:complete